MLCSTFRLVIQNYEIKEFFVVDSWLECSQNARKMSASENLVSVI